MNPRQRRGAVLLLLSALCALGAFVGVLSVVNEVESKVGPEVTAYRLAEDVPAYRPLDAGVVEQVRIPERWLPTTAVTDPAEFEGKIAPVPLEKGSLLQSDMLAEQPGLREGEQEITIMADAATGVAGRIRPGAVVNVYATFREEEDRETSRLIVDNARVTDVGGLAQAPRDEEGLRREAGAVPVTFALGTRDAHRVAFAESFAVNVRLALVAPGGRAAVPEDERAYTLAEDE